MNAGFNERGWGGWKILLGVGLLAPVLAGLALMPSGAAGGVKESTHDHASVDAGMGRELAAGTPGHGQVP